MATPRRKLGFIIAAAGLAVWGLGGLVYLGNVTGVFPTIPYAGAVTISVGALLEAVGGSLIRGEPVLGQVEQRRTSLVIVIPALLLFGLMLLGAAMAFASSPGVGSALFLAVSMVIVSVLVRDVMLRFSKPATPAAHPREVR